MDRGPNLEALQKHCEELQMEVERLRHSEAALQESEKKYRTLFETMVQGIVYQAADGRITAANPAAERILGLSLGEMQGRSSADPRWGAIREDGSEFPGEEHPSMVVLRTGKPVSEVMMGVFNPRENEYRWIRIHAVPEFRPGEDKPYQVYTTFDDITERKQVSERMAVLAQLLDVVPASVTVHDFQGNFIYANQKTFDLHGYRREEAPDLNLHRLDVPESRTLIEPRMKTILEQGEATFEVSHYREDGSIFPLQVTAKLAKWGDQQVILSAAIDIEGRKRVEEDLRESEARFRLLVENAPDAIFVRIKDRFAYVNPAAVKLFGASSPDELLGTLILDRLHPDYRATTRERMRRINTERAKLPPMETKYLRLDGTPVNVEAYPVPYVYAGENGALVFARDVGDRKRAEAERKSLEAQLRQAQKMEAIGTLAGGIAHDFNNILGVIIGCTELALMDLSEETATYRRLREVYRAGERAKDLVKQILAFSRRGEQMRKALDPTLIVKEGLKMLRSSLPSTIQIQQDIRRDCGTVLADPTHLHQVLMNLCVNAAHAMRERGGTLTVHLKHLDLTAAEAAQFEGIGPRHYCMLSVRDTGHGMDRAVLDRIFDPYFTTKRPGEGTGLGLAVVHGIVKGHGGAIRVESEPGAGSTFEVLLPVIDLGRGAEVKPDVRTVPGGSERILLVDDEEPLVRTGCAILEGLGYRVTATKSSREALEIFRDRPDQFDLVITDMTMPDMTGSELARHMLKIRADVPIILCTGYSDIITPERARDMGIREFLVKPIPLRNLAEAIRKTLA
ncbi:MAG: PAS domain S-box protein [Thermodesulfobacteriota bacterium]